MTDTNEQEVVAKGAKKATKATKSERKESVTLTFTTEAELATYDALKVDAENDDRTISKYITRQLQSK